MIFQEIRDVVQEHYHLNIADAEGLAKNLIAEQSRPFQNEHDLLAYLGDLLELSQGYVWFNGECYTIIRGARTVWIKKSK